ncbi:hypothetical protein PS467_39620 [Streptomyces luomodiensis]|uniref:Uncharacterized protein n=1 Tax=Streptomyces luomodiensis TaxID=3026192 RepID=A0ABY9V9U8_9ACTN|nr:hypothetical protein [Streptomyces sp. SCA4-21]WNF01018.1 hypothetical protein PS467_39620 [Streptomyces sp. SCA4-21]
MPLALNPLDAAQTAGALLGAPTAGALLGARTGRLIGRRAGRATLIGARGRHPRDGARRAEQPLTRHGQGKAIGPARCVPVVRTPLNPLAGTVDLRRRLPAAAALEVPRSRPRRTAVEPATGSADEPGRRRMGEAARAAARRLDPAHAAHAHEELFTGLGATPSDRARQRRRARRRGRAGQALARRRR